MSTDYGLRCQKCNEDIVINNMRHYAIEIISRDIKPLTELGKIHTKVDVELRAYWCEDIERFTEWLAKHENHPFIAVDEYGNEHEKINDTKEN